MFMGVGFRGSLGVLALFFFPYFDRFSQQPANFLFAVARDAYAGIVGRICAVIVGRSLYHYSVSHRLPLTSLRGYDAFMDIGFRGSLGVLALFFFPYLHRLRE